MTDSRKNARHVDNERNSELNHNVSQYLLNYTFQKKDPRDKMFKVTYKDSGALPDLPVVVDFRKDWGSILDQGNLGSCVSNSVSACLRYVLQKEKKKVFQPSRLFIYYYGRVIENSAANDDSGLFVRDGYKSVAKNKVCSENNWPYKESLFPVEPNENCKKAASTHSTLTYLAVPQDLMSIKQCLFAGFPISCGFNVYSSFMTAETARTGIMPVPLKSESQLGGHCITLVGYDDTKQIMIALNSWSENWGDKGFFYIPYSLVVSADFSDFWTARLFV